MKLNDLLTKEEKELPRQLAKEMVKLFRMGGKVPTFREFVEKNDMSGPNDNK